MNENDVIIDVKDLHKSYGQTEVIKGVDMTVRKGEVICIIGPSGAGKSTMMKTIGASPLVYRRELKWKSTW